MKGLFSANCFIEIHRVNMTKESEFKNVPPCIVCVQYIGGCSVHRGMFCTSGGYHEYIGGEPWVHRGDTMSTSGGYHEYIGGIPWVHRGIPWYMWGDTMSTSGGYHEYIGGISWVHWGMFSTLGFSIEIETILSSSSPTCIISLRCTEHPPMYSWSSPDVLMIIPRCTHDLPPMYSWYPSDVLNIPHIHHESPDVLNTPRCTEHTLHRVVRGWQFLTVEATEVLCMVCVRSEEHIFRKDVWVTDLSKSHIL